MPSLLARHIWTHFGSLLGIRFGTHFWSILEVVSGLILELIRDSFWNSFGARKVSRKVARKYTDSQSQPGKLALHASQVLSNYGSWTGACGPSWSCRVSHPKDVTVGALGPAGEDELMRVVFGCITLQNGRLLKGVGTPLSAPGFGLISGPFRRRFRDSFWS